MCSWSSEPESLCNNWRGWKRPITTSAFGGGLSKKSPEAQVVVPLTELAARCVASYIPFELVEHVFPPVPEQLQLRIAYWSFPDNEEDIRLYSCLANSSADEFHRGELLFKTRSVKEPLQIGFHLSASVVGPQPRTQFNVAVTFDRRRIASCNCTCPSAVYWCSHVVAVCLHRIHCSHEVCLRAPVSESLTRLQRDQLQKFAQYLISELPQQILPTAQRLLDELLSSQPTAINTVCGAPDPTAGASLNDLTNWYLDEKTLHDNIKKILIKFCLPSPMVFSDVNYLTNSAPPAAAEWSSLLRPLRGREPEGMWNLLSIVREMYRRCDRNSVRLLEIITEECMACDQILVWWFNTKLSLLIGTGGYSGGKHNNTHSNSNASQHACSSLCDEIVILWRLASLNPSLAPDERDMLHAQFTSWHLKILDRLTKSRVANPSHSSKQQQNIRTGTELFIGFKPAIEACYLDWEDYPIPGITHTQDKNPMYHSPFTCFKHGDSKSDVNSQVNSTQAIIHANVKLYCHPDYLERSSLSSSNNSNISHSSSSSESVVNNDGNRSSASSEGFCENDDDGVETSNVVEESRPGVTTVTTVTTKSTSLKLGKSTVQQQTMTKIKSSIPDKEPIGLLRRKHDIARQESSSGASNTSNSSSSSITNVLKYTKCRNDTLMNNNNCTVDISDNTTKVATNDLSSSSNTDNNCNNSDKKKNTNLTNTLTNNTIIDINKCFISNNNNSNKSNELLLGKSGSTCSIDNRNSSNIQILPGCSSSIMKSANNIINTNNVNSVTNKIKVCINNNNKNDKTTILDNLNTNNKSSGGLVVPKINGTISDINVSSPSSFYSTISKDSKSPITLSSSSSSSSLFKNKSSSSSGRADLLHEQEQLLQKQSSIDLLENTLTQSNIISIPESSHRPSLDVSTRTTTLTTGVTGIDKATDLVTRRPSKDGSVSSTESQHSFEDFKISYYERKPPQNLVTSTIAPEEPTIFGHRHKMTYSEFEEQKRYLDDFQLFQMPVQLQKSQYHYPSQPIHHNTNTTYTYNNTQTYKNCKNDPNSSKAQIFSNIKPTEDAWDILFARAEGLHAHGHGREACILAVRLAEEMLANPPNLMVELPIPPRRKGKKNNINPISHQITLLASATLAKSAFLCTVLAENSEHYHLAFKICMYGLQMPRLPASTKPLEVKLANQEADLLVLLKRIPLGLLELKMIRELAELLRDGTLRSRGEALLPIMLASFIFEALVMPSVSGKETRTKIMSISYRMPVDENLGFEAAVAALGLKANVSEADHPLLCEGTRRQRGDLALTLLYYYKDEPRKVAKIMDKLLDREIHTLIKIPLMSTYYSSNPPIRTPLSRARREEQELLQYNDTLQTEYNSNNIGSVASGNNRPHSCTSVEHENAFNVINVSSNNNMLIPSNQPQSLTPSLTVISQGTRIKDSRYKGKRAYPSIPNQPSEASAHFMFELAKIVLTKAGGTSSTSLFTQATTNQNHHGPHRALHMCAFQLGLYALGLHNCVSPNWLSRTYSSHVSWIMGQAMEIGAPGISFLIDTWEGHLTPPEAVGMADRASRGWDNNMIYPSAELALSVLPHAAALNPNEIQRAILQCKEQSDQMLERACITVENAAKGGGVYPEVLFQVARYWYELYLRNTPGGEMAHENDFHVDHNVNLGQIIESQEISQPNIGTAMANQSVVVTSTPPQPYQPGPIGITHYEQYNFPSDRLFPNCIPVPPIYPFPPPPKSHSFTFQQLQYEHMMNPDFSKLASYPPMKYYPNTQPYSTLQGSIPVPVAPPPGQMQPTMQFFNPPPNNIRSQTTHHGLVYPFVPPPPVRQRHPHQFSPTQLRYLLAAYNVGMLAMETLARRVHDDRPQAKYARNPPYGEDVKWLLQISKKLGTQYLHQFCVCAVNSIVSPFVLHDVAIESAQYLGRNNPAIVLQHLRSALTPLVQKCQQMYIQCIHQKLYHLTVADYEDFSSIIIAARAAFIITPEGNAQFKDWLQSIKRSKSCKKDLWAQITTALQANSK